MRKKEVRWISRDENGTYTYWHRKPKKENDGTWQPASNYSVIAGTINEGNNLKINLKCGGLAKIPIERQY